MTAAARHWRIYALSVAILLSLHFIVPVEGAAKKPTAKQLERICSARSVRFKEVLFQAAFDYGVGTDTAELFRARGFKIVTDKKEPADLTFSYHVSVIIMTTLLKERPTSTSGAPAEIGRRMWAEIKFESKGMNSYSDKFFGQQNGPWNPQEGVPWHRSRETWVKGSVGGDAYAPYPAGLRALLSNCAKI